MGLRDYYRRKEFELELAKSKHPAAMEAQEKVQKGVGKAWKGVQKDIAYKPKQRKLKSGMKAKPLLILDII